MDYFWYYYEKVGWTWLQYWLYVWEEYNTKDGWEIVKSEVDMRNGEITTC